MSIEQTYVAPALLLAAAMLPLMVLLVWSLRRQPSLSESIREAQR